MNSYGQTDTGRVRKSNQDSIFLSETPVGPLSNLFMVADGMGGHKAGDFASRFVVDTMVRCMGLYKSDSPVTALRKAIEKTNELLFLEAQRDPDREGMGSTLVAATVDQDTMYVANVGDSRLYLFGSGLSDHQGSFPGGGNGIPGEAGAEQRVLQVPEKHHHQGCGDPACGDRRFF